MEFSVNSISLVDIVLLIVFGLFLLVMHREEKERKKERANLEALKASSEALRASMDALKAEQNAMKDEDESDVH